MRSSIPLSIRYEPVEDGWVQARIEEIPGVITAARTRDEARAMVLDALREYLLAHQHGDPAPPGADRERLTLELAV